MKLPIVHYTLKCVLPIRLKVCLICLILTPISLFQESEESDIYACIQDLRDKKKDLEEQIGTYQKEGKQQGVQRLMEELSLTEENLLAKNDERRQRK